MTSFSQMRDLFKMQREAKRIKKELKNIHVEAEAPGIKVVVTAELEVVSIAIDPAMSAAEVQRVLPDVLNRAIKKAQVVSAEKMQGIMAQMGMPTGEAGLRGLSDAA